MFPTCFTANCLVRFIPQIAVGIFSFAIMVLIPIIGGLAFRKDRGGILSFQDALVGLMLICAISFAGSAIMGYLIPNVIDQNIRRR